MSYTAFIDVINNCISANAKNYRSEETPPTLRITRKNLIVADSHPRKYPENMRDKSQILREPETCQRIKKTIAQATKIPTLYCIQDFFAIDITTTLHFKYAISRYIGATYETKLAVPSDKHFTIGWNYTIIPVSLKPQ